MDILETSDYDAIRAALDFAASGLGEDEAYQVITDAIIEMSIYGPRAESYVKLRFPGWATATDDQTEILKRAVIFLTASYLAPSMPIMIRESFGDYSYTRSDGGFASLKKRLRAMAEEELILLLGEPNMPTLFTVACGRRGV